MAVVHATVRYLRKRVPFSKTVTSPVPRSLTSPAFPRQHCSDRCDRSKCGTNQHPGRLSHLWPLREPANHAGPPGTDWIQRYADPDRAPNPAQIRRSWTFIPASSCSYGVTTLSPSSDPGGTASVARATRLPDGHATGDGPLEVAMSLGIIYIRWKIAVSRITCWLNARGSIQERPPMQNSPSTETKSCSTCKQEKQITEFSISKPAIRRRDNRCRRCRANQAKKRYYRLVAEGRDPNQSRKDKRNPSRRSPWHQPE